MRVDATEDIDYGEYDPRIWGRNTRANDERPYDRSTYRRSSILDRFRSPGGIRMREHYGDGDTGSRFHDFVQEKFGLFVLVGVVALVTWIVSKILKLAFPAKWSFLQGLLNVTETIGWWAMIIAAIILIIGWILGHAHKFINWAKSRY